MPLEGISAVDRLVGLSEAYKTAVDDKHLKASDVYIRSIDTPVGAFVTGFWGRVVRWFSSFWAKEVSFTVQPSKRGSDGTTLTVKMYDTDSNVQQVRRLFEMALFEMPIKDIQRIPPENASKIVKFALEFDQLSPKPGSCHELLRNFLLSESDAQSFEWPPQGISLEKTVGQTLVESATLLAEEGRIDLDRLQTLFKLLEDDLNEGEKKALKDLVAKELIQHLKQTKNLDEIETIWKQEVEKIDESSLVLPEKSRAKVESAFKEHIAEELIQHLKQTKNLDEIEAIWKEVEKINKSSLALPEESRAEVESAFKDYVAEELVQHLKQTKNLDEIEAIWKEVEKIDESSLALPEKSRAKVESAFKELVRENFQKGTDVATLAAFYKKCNNIFSLPESISLKQTVIAACGRSLESTTDLAQVTKNWKNGMELMKAQGILSKENVHDSVEIIVKRLEDVSGTSEISSKALAEVYSTILKTTEVFDDLQLRVGQIAASIVNKKAKTKENPEEIFKMWREEMEQFGGVSSPILFQPRNFFETTDRLLTLWTKERSNWTDDLNSKKTYNDFQLALSDLQIKHSKKIGAIVNEIELLMVGCTPNVRESLKALLFLAGLQSSRAMYFDIQQQELSLIAKEIEKVQNNPLGLSKLKLALGDLKARLVGLSTELWRDEEGAKRNEACIRIVDQYVIDINSKESDLSKFVTTTTAATSQGPTSSVGRLAGKVRSAVAVLPYLSVALPLALPYLQGVGLAGAALSSIAIPGAFVAFAVGLFIAKPFILERFKHCSKESKELAESLVNLGVAGAMVGAAYTTYKEFFSKEVQKVQVEARPLPLVAPSGQKINFPQLSKEAVTNTTAFDEMTKITPPADIGQVAAKVGELSSAPKPSSGGWLWGIPAWMSQQKKNFWHGVENGKKCAKVNRFVNKVQLVANTGEVADVVKKVAETAS